MRPYNDYYDELDDIDGFAFERSQALQKMLENHRRMERNSHGHHHLDHLRGRRKPVNWDWQDDDDWD